MFTHGGQVVDPLVISVCFVVGGDEAFNLDAVTVNKNIQPLMPVENSILPVTKVKNDEWLDESDDTEGDRDLLVFSVVTFSRIDQSGRHEGIDS
jgi:hypothetical protein